MIKNKNDDIELLDDYSTENENIILTEKDIKKINILEEEERKKLIEQEKLKEHKILINENIDKKEVEKENIDTKTNKSKKINKYEKEEKNMSRKISKKKKKNKIIAIILSILVLIYVIWFISYLFNINLIPAKYLTILISVIGVITFIMIILLFGNKLARRISIVLIIINVLLSGVGYYYIEELNKTLNSISEATETEIYKVLVKSDSEYNGLESLVGTNLGIMKTNSKNYNKALENLLKEIKINTKEYENMNTMVMDLINDKIDSILISENNKMILGESIANFDKNIRNIKDISISVIKEKEKEYKHKYGPFNILISGIDTYGNINATSRSDVNIILTVNQYTHKVLISNVPRDTYVQLHGTTGVKDKLTHAGIYGIDMTRKTLEDFLETEIPYYVRVNFSSVEKIIDAIGGVDIYNDTYFERGGFTFRKGNIHLNGKSALVYARERYSLSDGDAGRGRHQEEIINAIIKKITSSTELLNSYGELMNTVGKYIQTNVPEETIRKYIKDQLDKMPSWDINKLALVNNPGYRDYTYSAPGLKLYVSPHNEESRISLSNSINSNLNKEK